MGFFAIIILLMLYFLPTIVAILRKAPDTGSVIVLNMFLGWTFLGWVISMAMAARSNTTASINVNVSQQPGYGYAGVAYGQAQPAMAATYGAPQAPQLPAQQPNQLPQPQLPQVLQVPGDQVRRPDQTPLTGPVP